MKLTREALRQLSVPALIALVLTVAGVGVLAASDRFAYQAQKDFEGARLERVAVQTKLLRATDEERELRAKLSDYQRLRQRGILGDERRLDWVEAIKAIKAERKLYDVRYNIEARRVVDYPGLKQTGDVELLMSRMRLEAILLHEIDLLNLLADLSARIAPVVSIRSCRIDRTDRAMRANQFAPRLRAECLIDLVTIRDRAEKE